MPSAGPETALSSTIDGGTRGIQRPRQNYASCGLAEALYDKSITYTKAQRLYNYILDLGLLIGHNVFRLTDAA